MQALGWWWALGELAGREVDLPGPTVLSGGEDATIPGVLGIPRLWAALALLAVVGVVLARYRARERTSYRWQWDWPVLGSMLAVATVGGWLLAGWSGASFGPSTVGAVAGVASGSPPWWLVAFLVGIVVGAGISATWVGAFDVRGEVPLRIVGLAVGGFLLGLGGWVAGGCNLGHGLSGVAQLNVSSWVVVAAIVVGVAATSRIRIL